MPDQRKCRPQARKDNNFSPHSVCNSTADTLQSSVATVHLTGGKHARLRVYCLPPSGCGPEYYAPWTRHAPAELEICSFSLPGRGQRSGEPSQTDPRRLAAEIAAAINGCDDPRPFAVFGHSVGALIAYLATCTLRHSKNRTPDLLALSALPAPHLGLYTAALPPRLAAGLAGLTDLIGPLPESLIHTPMAAALCTPILADLLLLLHYRHSPEEAPLDLPLSLYGATHDPVTDTSTLTAWNELVTTPTTPRLFPGAHTYPADHTDALVHQLTHDLATAGTSDRACE
ncbi:alpha/beta fold hydrolase [Streptomyces sp. TRM72054]|uniref:thioesterase II family protein n=1 Tax=Streptomyces sp. TRM72054 TaxID=2870562 RepID=UPI001C8CCBC5|nr:alpha/beta fold hydrolase [Streptomyces sp. TRM72054]MBX9399395.1 alpha/beta fold hydrolase [Streptomyces sp. TRM72054]